MVLTVTINPILERRLFFERVENNEVNRSNKEIFKAGGKGINVSRQLNFLGIKNLAYTFLGGHSGKQIRQILSDEKIDYTFVNTKSETRSATLAIEESKNSITSYFGPNNEIQKKEADEFKSKLEKMILNCSTVIFSGSSPSEFANEIFPYGIELAHKHDKISILDTYGKHLEECIEKIPTVIHNNISEIESSLNTNLTDEKSKLDYLDFLYRKGIKLAFLTDGANPAYASKYDFHYMIENPQINEIDGTGSGDAFMAGIIYGIENSMVFDDFIKTASALGTANAKKLSACDVTPEEMHDFTGKVKLFTLGKKMKQIDDSPTI